ncbi:MAG: hypothetical protein QXG39_09300 [Candidatus Aenigmatarchaeota archaeon]
MRKLAVLLLIPLLLLSGCVTIPGVQTGAKGGDISVSLSVDSTEIPAGSPLGLSISIENKALMPMKNISINITAPEGWKLSSPQPSVSDIQREGSWEGVWIYTAPSEVMVDTPYKFYARVTFSMNTTRGASITLVNYDYYKRTGEKSKVSTQTPDTGGPIGIEFGQLGQMSYMYTGQGATIPLKVIISNRGSGKAYVGDEPNSTNLNKVKFEYSGNFINCSVPDDKIVYLMKEGSVATVMCNINIPADQVSDVKTISVSVTVSYNYVYDLVSPTITVKSTAYS